MPFLLNTFCRAILASQTAKMARYYATAVVLLAMLAKVNAMSAPLTGDLSDDLNSDYVTEVIKEQNTEEFAAGVKALTGIFITAANLSSNETFVPPNGKCGLRCPGCCIDRVLPRQTSCIVQRIACDSAATGCTGVCTAAVGVCSVGCEAGRTVCVSRVCT